ncbi:hypothetical protein CANMA_003142 [Candida margitis]|uniref:uncharacterized protein n=1 Tax=Candida margitis TaxID=1775924 RepID=UPI002226F422|nr:uncharacterized protein CANMA_003142 [Candida margitis]KAI5967322.1 hypothetical protein CANMA_003142 [Candida margitis]
MLLIKSLCDELLSSNKSIKIIGIVAQAGEKDILSHEEGDTLEIGLTKEMYLRIFKESHEYFNSHYDDRLNIESLSHSQLDKMYYMTLGYLITTNEHSTIIALHEELVHRLGNYKYDLEIVSSFLTCRMKRINKSSSLWHWLRKLTINQIRHSDNLRKLLQRALVSCQLHFANYYANNYLQWLITMFRLTRVELEDFQDSLLKSCRAQLSDSSLWGTLKVYLKPDDNMINYIVGEYKRFTGLDLPKTFARVDHDSTIIQLFEWLLRSQCTFTTPFRVLTESTDSLKTLSKLEQMLNGSALESSCKVKKELIKRKELLETI